MTGIQARKLFNLKSSYLFNPCLNRPCQFQDFRDGLRPVINRLELSEDQGVVTVWVEVRNQSSLLQYLFCFLDEGVEAEGVAEYWLRSQVRGGDLSSSGARPDGSGEQER